MTNSNKKLFFPSQQDFISISFCFWIVLIIIILALLIGFITPAFADNSNTIETTQPITTNDNTDSLVTSNSTINQLNEDEKAKMWGLPIKEYQHYEWLMTHTSNGKWYKELNPPEVLGINAEDKKEMMKYAKIVARNTHIRVSQELAFNAAYSLAYRELYPQEKAIMPNRSYEKNISQLQTNDHIWYFTGLDQSLNQFILPNLIKIVQKTSKTYLDIYLVGDSLSNAKIQQWAEDNNISSDEINHTITLNYGNKRFQSIKQQINSSVTLPIVGILHDNHFKIIPIDSLLS